MPYLYLSFIHSITNIHSFPRTCVWWSSWSNLGPSRNVPVSSSSSATLIFSGFAIVLSCLLQDFLNKTFHGVPLLSWPLLDYSCPQFACSCSRFPVLPQFLKLCIWIYWSCVFNWWLIMRPKTRVLLNNIFNRIGWTCFFFCFYFYFSKNM